MTRIHDDGPMTPDDEQEEALDPRIAGLARAYNAPPLAPREAMWARIEAARAARGTVAPVAPVATLPAATPVISLDAARASRRPARAWAILAAGLAAGVVLGVGTQRWLQRDDATGTPSTVAVVAPVESRDTGTTPMVDTGVATPPDVKEEGATPLRPAPSASQYATQPAGAPRIARGNASGVAGGTADIAPRAATRAAEPASALYRMAAVQTLTQAEALLVAWRADAPAVASDTAAMRQLGQWSRDVLSSTRLLLDSPAARDPELRRLLDDLELVLAQVVQLSGAPMNAEERALVERALRQRDLLPRLRSAVPAGAAAQT